MSTTTSPTPPKPGLSPFKEQTPFDPYLPSSTEDEQLTQISPDQDSSSTTKPAQPKSAPSQPVVDPAFARRVSARSEEAFEAVDRVDSYGFGSLEGFEPQGFDNTLLLEHNFGPLPAPDDFNDMNFFRHTSFKRSDTGRTEEPQSATSKATDFSRRSTGIATHSSQLMSPVLTDIPSPNSGDEGPAERTKLLGGGANMTRLSSQSTATTSTPTNNVGLAQRTPDLTSSSNDVSPSITQHKQSFSHAPVIQVDYHRRGDSPARVDDIHLSLNKRRRGSRSSSLMAAHSVQEVEELDEPGDMDEQHAGARFGLNPQARGDEAVTSLEEQQQQRQVTEKNQVVSNWLTESLHAGPAEDPNPPVGTRQHLGINGARRRAVSNSNPANLRADADGISRGLQESNNSRIPGPGVLINEDSGDEEMDDDDDTGSFVESAPASIDGNEAAMKAEELDMFPTLDESAPRRQEAHPWVDPINMPSADGMTSQPETANAAMVRFMKRARDIETASRVATWGTITRRRSDGDFHEHVERVFGSDGLFSRLSISRSKDRTEKEKDDWQNFKESVHQAKERFLPKRNDSATKRKGSEPRPGHADSYFHDPLRRDSTRSRKESSASIGSKSSAHTLLSRIPSTKRPKSPRINTSGLAAAVATQVGALGVSGPMHPASPPSPSSWRAFKETAKEKFGFSSKPESPEITRYSSPPPVVAFSQPTLARQVDFDDDAEGDDADDVLGIKMEMVTPSVNIIPTFEGFKAHIRETNPRLPAYLVTRLGQEQLRRYKKLVQAKVDHAKAKELGNCPSGKYCVHRGGQPTYFPPKNNQAETSRSALAQSGAGDDDDDDEAVADGAVSEAQFPVGLPLPPAKRLPAQFECPLCFTVKKFNKPSDWSKHVHEDLQPFTCTFKLCPEPKSFKRKADWVRHENERHRQLEWWQCNEGCSHLCYRRDNFVQHLVREHKMPEPKAKNNSRPNKPAVRGPAKGKVKVKGNVSINDIPPEDRVLHMVETCRRETTKNPADEPCRFCGNHCNSFKKLTVHLARHMETLSLPILELVKAKDVSADTTISPIDAKLMQQELSPIDRTNFANSIDASPYNQTIGLDPDIGAVMQQPQYQQMWGGQSTHMNQQPPAAYSDEMANGWGTSNGMFGQAMPASFNAFSGSGPYMQHNAVASPELYNMGSTSSPDLSNASATGASFPMPLDQRPQFTSPHYVDPNGTGVNGGLTPTMAPQDDMNLQYDLGGSTGYQHASSGGVYGQEPQPRAGQHQFYGF